MSNMAPHKSAVPRLMVYRPMSAGANEGAGCIGRPVEYFRVVSFHD
jgi:hypothetical protein